MKGRRQQWSAEWVLEPAHSLVTSCLQDNMTASLSLGPHLQDGDDSASHEAAVSKCKIRTTHRKKYV